VTLPERFTGVGVCGKKDFGPEPKQFFGWRAVVQTLTSTLQLEVCLCVQKNGWNSKKSFTIRI